MHKYREKIHETSSWHVGAIVSKGGPENHTKGSRVIDRGLKKNIEDHVAGS